LTRGSRENAFFRLLLPGFVFQSVVIAGGYGTGRELAEFFLGHAPRGGLMAIVLVTTPIWSLVCAVTFELARMSRAYDYRSFFQALLGRAWFLFEIAYLSMLVLVLAVIAAAAGSILEESFSLPYWIGVGLMMAAIGVLLFEGTGIIERFLAGWSMLLYAVYLTLFVWALLKFGSEIRGALASAPAEGAWALGGLRYAAYNLATIPPILFVARHLETRRDALVAGALAGPIAIIPGLLFYIAMVGFHPGIQDDPLPATRILAGLGSPAFALLFQVVLFGTLVETGTGLIHGFNERMAGFLGQKGKGLPRGARAGISTAMLLLGAGVAQFGLIGLIARGYGAITWVFMAVYVVPVVTLGAYRVLRNRGSDAPPSPPE
jgi:uncharacterized membrane protein YkvI